LQPGIQLAGTVSDVPGGVKMVLLLFLRDFIRTIEGEKVETGAGAEK
jgi:hypothetical protein